MGKQYWLVKQEPEDYSWSDFEKDGRTAWTGVRNFQARKHLRLMQAGDEVYYYHSGEAREVVGVARVLRAAYPDPTATEGDWSCVDLEPMRALRSPVTLKQIKADPQLKDMQLVRSSRLSVSVVTEPQWKRIQELAGKPS